MSETGMIKSDRKLGESVSSLKASLWKWHSLDYTEICLQFSILFPLSLHSRTLKRLIDIISRWDERCLTEVEYCQVFSKKRRFKIA